MSESTSTPAGAGRTPDELVQQVRFLEAEVGDLRRRLTDVPGQSRGLELRLADTQRSLAAVTSQNERLAQTLREARDQIMKLKEEVDRLAQPPAGFGTFLARNEDDSVDVFTGGRKLRVNVSPAVDLDELVKGQEVMLNEALNVVAALDFEKVGEVVMFKELLEDGERGLVIANADEERVVRLAKPLFDEPLRAGDSLLLDARAGYAYERVPKSEVEELVLEEVPDIDYSQIGGLVSQIDAIRDAVELPYLHPELFKDHQLKPPEGRPALRPARLRQDADRQGGRQLAGQEGRGQDRPGGEVLLPQHQGSRAPQQVRRRDRAPHPAGLPAGPREGLDGHPGHRVLRRDGLAVPHPRLGRLLRRGEHHRPAAAQRDRRRRAPRERPGHRRLQPRGHDRPRHPAARPPRREDQDRASRRGVGARHLHQVPRRALPLHADDVAEFGGDRDATAWPA